MMEVPQVLIPENIYDQLVEDAILLDYLRRAGVDNWDGYSFAIEMMNEDADD